MSEASGMRWNPDKVRIAIARDLREIRRLYAGLRVEAWNHADDPDMPGGAAMVMLGPSADPEAWSYAEISAALGRTEVHGEFENDADPVPPLLTLATWEDAIRAELGTETTAKATVEGTTSYISSAINWMLDDDENGDINFLAVDELAADLRKVRTRLENILRDGHRSDTGAPCIECGNLLVKVWRESKEHDQWECRNRDCDDHEKPVDGERYKNAVKAGYLAKADRLTATDMLEAYRIKPGTLAVWAHRKLVRKRGKDDSGRILYDVDDAIRQRDSNDDEAA